MTDDESPQEHIRHAIALLMAEDERVVGPTGLRLTYTEDTIEAAKRRLWRAVEQLEGKKSSVHEHHKDT